MSNLDKQVSLTEQLLSVKNNPTSIQELALRKLDEAHSGKIDIPDANNPFMYGLEFAAMVGSAIMSNHELLTMKRYRKLASSYDDLYHHMSDEDYPGRWGEPSRIGITLAFNADEIRKRAVETADDFGDGSSIYSMLIIPRNTTIMVQGIAFSFEFPIEIRVMKHGGFVVVYDVSQPSPFMTLSSNQVDTRLLPVNGSEYLMMNIDLRQIQGTPYWGKITPAGGFKETYPLSGSYFYGIRVFTRKNTTDEWDEAYVTHSDLVYDATKLTFTAKVLEDTVRLTLPEIYLASGWNELQVRADVYTTKGKLLIDTSTIRGSTTQATWRDFNYEANVVGRYSAPLSNFSERILEIRTGIMGGKDGMSVEELRESVIYGGIRTDKPITPGELSVHLSRLGFDELKAEDVPTLRKYQITRALPVQDNKSLSESIGIGIMGIQESIDSLAVRSTVRDNGSRVTITPDAIYQYRDGFYHILHDTEMFDLRAKGPDELAREINKEQYYFTPFYYVLDTNDNLFDTRVYSLDTPDLPHKTFVYENNSIGVELSIDKLSIERVASGYQIVAVTSSDKFYKDLKDSEVACQMLFKPERESAYAYLNGVLKGRSPDGERVWVFNLDTSFDVTKNDELILTSFSQFGNNPSKLRTLLSGEFTILNLITRNSVNEEIFYTDSDDKIGEWYFNERMAAVTEQSWQVHFGDALTYLYTRSRSIISEEDVLRYTEDIPWRYDQDEYKRENGMLVFDANGKPIKLHKKGDIVYDSEGVVMYRYKTGDIKRDNDGNPIPVNDRVVIRDLDIIGLDGCYYFSDNQADIDYLREIKQAVTDWVTRDIANLNKRLLEVTSANFRPKQSLGYIDVIVNSKEERRINAAVAFNIVYYLTDSGFKNANLRNSLSQITPSAIAGVIDKETFGVSDLIAELRKYKTDDVVDIVIERFGTNKDIDVITVLDASMRCAIKKKLHVNSDSTLTVLEDISIEFAKHKDSIGKLS